MALITFFQGVIGTVQPPTQLATSGYGTGASGLVALMSNLIKLIIIVGGLWAFINLLLAGLTYITTPDKPDELSKANSRMYMSLIGLVIMVGSFALAGIFGWLLFKNPTALISPTVYGPK